MQESPNRATLGARVAGSSRGSAIHQPHDCPTADLATVEHWGRTCQDPTVTSPSAAEHPQAEPLDVPDGYGLNEVGENHASLASVLERFGTERTWWLATSRSDGRPHTAPLWGVYVDGQLLFSSDARSTKSINLASGPHAVIHLESGDQVAIIEGRTALVAGADLPSDFVPVYAAKYGFEVDTPDPAFTFYRLDPVKVMSWDESDFAATAARWRFTN